MNNLNNVRGAPDTDFGVRGEVVLYGERGQRLQARVVTLLSSPNRILCGATDEERQETYLCMLDEEGRIDKSFGNAGSVVFKLSEFFPGWDSPQPYSVKFDSGKYVLGFFARKNGFNRATGLARFDLNGKLDEGFGSKGVMLWSPDLKDVVPSSSDVPKVKQPLTDKGRDYHGTLELLDDGGVLLLTTLDDRGLFYRAFLVKLKNNGSLDETFGDGGYRLVFRGPSVLVIGQDMFRQGNGYVVAASDGLRDKRWFVGRYDARGNLDSSFGAGGYYDGVPSVKSVILKHDDKFYIVGTSDNGVPQYLYLQLQRRGLNGEEDPLFGKQGWGEYINDDFSDIYMTKAALYNLKSTVVVAGYAYLRGGSDSQAFIASLEQDMGWDEGFGDVGKVLFPKDQIIHDLAVQEDRKIVFVSSRNRGSGSFAIFRRHG
ncbi:hypothetical protein V9L13_00205 [Pseudomonas sp. RSB 5.4]|uniref:hypothetical protein n=1 Tax=Pseudomonas sp. RSB 5.4 TaxID=3127459 RepID=UPI0030D262D2